MRENLISESSISYSPEQLEELIAFVGPVDLPTLASNYKSTPEKFRRQLTGYIVLSACRGQSAEQISRSLKDHDIFICGDNISFLLSTWNDLQQFSPEELRDMKQSGEAESGGYGEKDEAEVNVRLELVDRPSSIGRQVKSQEDYWRFVNLNGDEDVFDIEKARDLCEERHKTLRMVPTGADRENQLLYETEDGRFVLVFSSANLDATPPPWLDRELSPQEASLWFIVQNLLLPEPLKPVPIRDPSEDPSSRLNPGWKPSKRGHLPKNATVEEKTQILKDYMDKHPKATAEQAYRATGIPVGTIRNHFVWKAVKAGEKAKKPTTSISTTSILRKEVPFTREIEQARGDPRQVNPASEVDAIDLWEYIESQYVDDSDGDRKARYYRLTRDEQMQELRAYAQENGLASSKE